MSDMMYESDLIFSISHLDILQGLKLFKVMSHKFESVIPSAL